MNGTAEIPTNDPTPLADRLRVLLDYLEPTDEPSGPEATVLALVADALTVDDIDTLGGLINRVRVSAEQRGADGFYVDELERLRAREAETDTE